MRGIDITGRKQPNGWLVPRRYLGNRKWDCICTHGGEYCKGRAVVTGSDFRRGSSRSCGCLKRERSRELGRAFGKLGLGGRETWTVEERDRVRKQLAGQRKGVYCPKCRKRMSAVGCKSCGVLLANGVDFGSLRDFAVGRTVKWQFTHAQVNRMLRHLYLNGETYAEVGGLFGCSWGPVKRILRDRPEWVREWKEANSIIMSDPPLLGLSKRKRERKSVPYNERQKSALERRRKITRDVVFHVLNLKNSNQGPSWSGRGRPFKGTPNWWIAGEVGIPKQTVDKIFADAYAVPDVKKWKQEWLIANEA